MDKSENTSQTQLVIENYDNIVKKLIEELHILKCDQQTLGKQFIAVVDENKQLSERLHNTLSSNCKISNHLSDELNDNEILNNLKQQINGLKSEKDCVIKLWQESIKTIDYLEDELKIFQAGTKEFVSKKHAQQVKLKYEEKIHQLESELNSTKQQLAEIVQCASENKTMKNNQIGQSLETQANALKIIKNLELEVLKLQQRLQECIEQRIQLEDKFCEKEIILQGIKKKNDEYLYKVTEAISVVEAALNEKDAALLRETQLKDENEKLVDSMTEIIKESEEKIKREIQIAKNLSNEKENHLMKELSKVQNELKNKNEELDKSYKKCVLLENEIEKMQKFRLVNNVEDPAHINKLLILEKNLESTFQKLLTSEKQNIQLASEKETIKNDLEQMANIYETNVKAKNIEIESLKLKIGRLENELIENDRQINQLINEIERLREQMKKSDDKFVDEFKNLRKTHEDDMEQITTKYNNNIKEMHLQIENKNEINQKWREESKKIISKLEKIVSNTKNENHTLKKENKNLKEILSKFEEKIKQYKTFLELISNDVYKMSHLAVNKDNIS